MTLRRVTLTSEEEAEIAAAIPDDGEVDADTLATLAALVTRVLEDES